MSAMELVPYAACIFGAVMLGLALLVNDRAKAHLKKAGDLLNEAEAILARADEIAAEDSP